MRYILLLPVWLGLLGGSTPSVELHAQEIPPAESPLVQIETPTDRVIRFFNTPDQVEHAGLLGKNYVQGRYVDQGVDDPYLRQFENSWQGSDTLINLPAVTLNTPTPLDVDVFFGYSNVGLSGTRLQSYHGDFYITQNRLRAKSESYDIGVSVYLTESGRWRPFIQTGLRARRSEVKSNSQHYDNGNPFGTLSDYIRLVMNIRDTDASNNYVRYDTRLLLNTGFEYDLMDSLAYRMTLFTETKDRFRDSVVAHDLILWPVNRLFLRGGLATQLDGGHIGFSLGGGVAF